MGFMQQPFTTGRKSTMKRIIEFRELPETFIKTYKAETIVIDRSNFREFVIVN